MRYRARDQVVDAVQWRGVHGEPAQVRTPAGSAAGAYQYGVVDTPQGPKPIERGDWLVIATDGTAVPWRPEHFAQVFIPDSSQTQVSN